MQTSTAAMENSVEISEKTGNRSSYILVAENGIITFFLMAE